MLKAVEFERTQDFGDTIYLLYIVTYHISMFVGLERVTFLIYLIIYLSKGDTSKSECDRGNFSNYARIIG